MNKIIPDKLKVGDEIRVIAPSRNLNLLSDETMEIATNRLESLGFKVTFGKNVRNVFPVMIGATIAAIIHINPIKNIIICFIFLVFIITTTLLSIYSHYNKYRLFLLLIIVRKLKKNCIVKKLSKNTQKILMVV